MPAEWIPAVGPGTIDTIADCTFENNQAEKIGGAVVAAFEGTIDSITRCAFVENKVTHGFGGAIANKGGIVRQVSDSFFVNNRASSGAESVYIHGEEIKKAPLLLVGNYFYGSGTRGDLYSSDINARLVAPPIPRCTLAQARRSSARARGLVLWRRGSFVNASDPCVPCGARTWQCELPPDL